MIAAVLMIAAFLQGTTPVPMRSLERSSQSFVDTAKQFVARTPAEWEAIWKQHAPARPAPEVDFSKDMVVGVFLGSRNSAGYSVEIVGVEKEAAGVVVRYRETRPGRGAITAQIITSPYHFVAVPKADGTVRFEKID